MILDADLRSLGWRVNDFSQMDEPMQEQDELRAYVHGDLEANIVTDGNAYIEYHGDLVEVEA